MQKSKSNTKVIRVADDLYSELAKRGDLESSFNSVLAALLKDSNKKGKMVTSDRGRD